MVVGSLGAPVDPGLAGALGVAAARALEAALIARTRRWAAAVAPGRAYEATTGGGAWAALQADPDIPPDAPVLLVAPDVPALGEHHARTALADLEAGVEIVVAPSNDGSPFLLAFPRVDAVLLDLAGLPFSELAAAAASRGTSLGMLRAERRLTTHADARALAADPLADPELLALLASG